MLVYSGPFLLTGAAEDQPTPVSLACEYGHLSVLRVFFRWSLNEKVVIDPSGPQSARNMDYDGVFDHILGVDLSDEFWEGLFWKMESRQFLTRNVDFWRRVFGKIDLPFPFCSCLIPSSRSITFVARFRFVELMTFPWSASVYVQDPPVVMAVRDGLFARKPLSVKLALLEMLADYGFDLDQRAPGDGASALTAAVEQNSARLVEVLTLQYNCRVSVALSGSGFTPLHLACQMQHWRLVPLLLRALKAQEASEELRGASVGANAHANAGSLVNRLDAAGRTCLDIAVAALPSSGGRFRDVIAQLAARASSRGATEICAKKEPSGAGPAAEASGGVLDRLRAFLQGTLQPQEPSPADGISAIPESDTLDAADAEAASSLNSSSAGECDPQLLRAIRWLLEAGALPQSHVPQQV